MPSINRILCLDQLSSQILLYDMRGKLVRRLGLDGARHIEDTRILYAGWSDREQRLAACMQDRSVAFWDWRDDFGYEHLMKLGSADCHSMIYYVEYCGAWISVDSDNTLHKWDIYAETEVAFPKHHTQHVMEVAEAANIPALLVSSLDKQIALWDVKLCKLITTIRTEGISMHSLAYSELYSALFAAGFDTQIYVWKFGLAMDATLAQRVSGHNGQITSLILLERKNMVITTDEIGFVKSWDILSWKCLQNLGLEIRAPFSKGLLLGKDQFVLAANRMYFFRFDRLDSLNQSDDMDSGQTSDRRIVKGPVLFPGDVNVPVECCRKEKEAVSSRRKDSHNRYRRVLLPQA